MNKKMLVLILIVIPISLMLGVRQVVASNVDYSVIPYPSENQLNRENTYYDLKFTKNEKENLKVRVKNNSDKEITIETNVDKATTNSNGVVEYKNSSKHKSADLKYDIKDFVKADKVEIVLAPHTEEDIIFEVTQPNEDFDGVIAGGLNFTQKLTDDYVGTSSMAVRNQYSYSIALVLHGNKDLIKYNITHGSVEVKQSNGRNNIYFPIKNNTAAFFNKVNIRGEIYTRKGRKAVYSDELSNGQVAPNSIYEYLIGTNQTKLKPGKYTAKIVVESKGEKWVFTDNFEISEKESKKLNNTGVIKKKDYSTCVLIGSISVLLIIFLIFVAWYIQKKNKEVKELKNQYRKNKD